MINSNLGLILHRLATITHNDLQGHPKSMISIQSDKAYATSYSCLIVTLAFLAPFSQNTYVTDAQTDRQNWRRPCQ